MRTCDCGMPAELDGRFCCESCREDFKRAMELSDLTLEVLDIIAEVAPSVNVRRSDPTYWTKLGVDEVDEQEWQTNLLLTDPRVFFPSRERGLNEPNEF